MPEHGEAWRGAGVPGAGHGAGPHDAAASPAGPSGELQTAYQRWYPRWVAIVAVVTGDLGRAESAVATAVARAAADPGRFPPDAVLAGALAGARPSWRDRLPRRLTGRPAPVLPPLSPESTELAAALRRLPLGEREAVALYHLGEVSRAGLPGLLDLPPAEVDRRLARGEARLAAVLGTALPAVEPMELPRRSGPRGLVAARADVLDSAGPRGRRDRD